MAASPYSRTSTWSCRLHVLGVVASCSDILRTGKHVTVIFDKPEVLGSKPLKCCCVLPLDRGCPLVFERQDFCSHCSLQRSVRLFGFCHSFRFQINPVNLATLRCHNERPVSNSQRLNENVLNVLLEVRVNPIREDRQIPKLLVGPDTPRLNVCATTIVVRSDVSNALMNYRLDLCWRGTLRKRQRRRQQRYCKENDDESGHRREAPNENGAAGCERHRWASLHGRTSGSE